ncbi:MAG: hypothetical protein ACM3MG_08105, partial [Bacillota bacterium]
MTQMVPGLKIGILLPSQKTSKYLSEFLKEAPSSCSIQCLSWNRPLQSNKRSFISRQWKKILTILDGRYLNWTPYRGHFNQSTVAAQTISSLEELKGFDFDYLLSLDGSPFEPQILETTKNGALLLNAGIPSEGTMNFSGFWEVYDRQATTSFSILHQKKDQSLESVVEGSLLTQSSFLLNQAYITHKALYYLRTFLDKIARGEQHTWKHLKGYGPTEPRKPGISALALYIAKRIIRNIQEKVEFRKGAEQQWNVAFHHNNWNPHILNQGIPFEISTTQFFADPFVITKNGHHYCFVEEFDFKTALGHISVFELTNEKALPLGAVLKEPFHLSFPYLFEYENELYMCPETSGANEIRIYKCMEFPLKWTYEKTLMKNIAAVDSMIFKKDEKWWMLTNIDPLQKKDHCTELCAFYADSPLSDSWTSHPGNPLVIDPLKARNAGLVRKDQNLFRIAQEQSFGVYGAASRIHQITRLSETEYTE